MGAPEVTESSTLERSPAPGVFIVRVESESDDRGGSVIREWRLQVLADNARIALAESRSPPWIGSSERRPLELLAEFEEWTDEGPDSGTPSRVAWFKLSETRLEAVLGFTKKALTGFAFDPAPTEGAKVITPLTPDMFCPFIASEPSRFPPDFANWCGENWRPSPTGAPAGKSDAGGTP
jgi:hypothetical protein